VSIALVSAGVLFVLFGVIVVVVELRRGDSLFGLLRSESAETRRAVRQAMRDGETDDPHVDHLARRVLRAASRQRWARYFFGGMLALSVLLLAVGPYSVSNILLRSAQILLWSGLIALNVINQRRHDNYRGLRSAVQLD
jgi:hypothetical protein